MLNQQKAVGQGAVYLAPRPTRQLFSMREVFSLPNNLAQLLSYDAGDQELDAQAVVPVRG